MRLSQGSARRAHAIVTGRITGDRVAVAAREIQEVRERRSGNEGRNRSGLLRSTRGAEIGDVQPPPYQERATPTGSAIQPATLQWSSTNSGSQMLKSIGRLAFGSSI